MIVRSATNLEWSSALRVLFEHLPQEERAIRVANTLALLRNSDLDKRSVLGAWIGDTLVGAHLIAPLKGDCAMAWPAQVKSGINPAIADTLMRAGLAQAQARGATFVQVILSAQDAGITGSLLRASYREVTELVYMVHPLGAIQTPAQSQSQKPLTPGPSPLSTGERGAYRQALRYETSDVADPALFQQTLMETYEGTLDCPELNNIRSVEQIWKLIAVRGGSTPSYGGSCGITTVP